MGVGLHDSVVSYTPLFDGVQERFREPPPAFRGRPRRRRNLIGPKLCHGPLVVGQACGHSRCALDPSEAIAADRETKAQTLVIFAEVVSATDDIHTGGKGLGLASRMASATVQSRQSLAKSGVQPFNVGCVDDP